MTDLNPVLRYTLLGFATLAVGATLLLFVGATETEDWFSWTIVPPISAATLGAFYCAALALLVAGAYAGSWSAVRPIVFAVLVISTLLLIVTLIHLDKFDMDSVFGPFWLGAYIVAPPLLAYGAWRETTTAAAGATSSSPLPPPLAVALAAEGAVMICAAVPLIFAPETADDFWPWALTPLTSRAIGSFLPGVAVVALMAARGGRAALTGGTVAAYAILGAAQLAAVALHRPDLGSDDLATGLYLGFWAAVLATGIYGVLVYRGAEGRGTRTRGTRA